MIFLFAILQWVPNSSGQQVWREMFVQTVIRNTGSQYYRVHFFEDSRFFKVHRGTDTVLCLLDAMENKKEVKILLDSSQKKVLGCRLAEATNEPAPSTGTM